VQILLRTSSRKLFFRIFSLLSALAYIWIAGRDYVAYRLAFSESPHAVEQAIALDPSNAAYRNRLGDYFMFSEQRPDLAIPEYASAVALNPHISTYWLHLGSAYASTGAGGEQERALERALEVDPRTPQVLRQVGDAFFIRGDFRSAFRIYRARLQADPEAIESTLQLCWQATHNVDAMVDVLPPTPNVYIAFLRLLVDEGNTTAAAEKIWSRLVTLRQPFDPQLAKPYVEYLIAQHDVNGAQAAWNDLARIDPDFRQYETSVANLVVNGGFEAKLLNMGFDWRYEDSSDVSLTIDREQFHGGRRSLSMNFGGPAIVDTGLSQFIAVEPNTRYNFSVYVRADDIFTAHGPLFAISDAYTKDSFLLTEETLGSIAWKQVSGSFLTGSNTDLVLLKIMREPGAGPITGTLWIDDVAISRE